MDMAQYDDWLDGINVRLASSAGSAANVPRVIVVHAVRSVVKDFLQRTKIWVYSPRVATSRLAVRAVSIPRDSFICKLWTNDCKPCFEKHAYFEHPNIINLSGMRDSDIENETLEGMQVSLSVTQSSLECPMFIFDRYYEAILAGTMASLQAMPGKDWSNPNMVEYHSTIYDQAVKDARTNLDNSFNKTKKDYSIPPNFM
jgi:hypothetical protein